MGLSQATKDRIFFLTEEEAAAMTALTYAASKEPEYDPEEDYEAIVVAYLDSINK